MSSSSLPGSTGLTICSLNARGLGSRAKLKALLQWAASTRYDIVAIQDHQLKLDPFVGDGGEEASRVVWGGPHFFVPGSQQHQGVLLLLSPKAPISDVSLYQPSPPPPLSFWAATSVSISPLAPTPSHSIIFTPLPNLPPVAHSLRPYPPKPHPWTADPTSFVVTSIRPLGHWIGSLKLVGSEAVIATGRVRFNSRLS